MSKARRERREIARGLRQGKTKRPVGVDAGKSSKELIAEMDNGKGYVLEMRDGKKYGPFPGWWWKEFQKGLEQTAGKKFE
jgi:hypothetical protein